MWRVLLITSIVYGCGHPVHDGYRPALFDRPLQAFHETVNVAAQDGKKGLAYLGDSRPVRYLKDHIARLDPR
jgi:hypothetical protein